MTSEERAAIKARAEAATSAPWETCDLDGRLGYVYSPGLGDVVAGSATNAFLIEDATFIAHARTDVPALVAALEAWREWAQFVWLGGGPPEGTDDDLRRRVCEAADQDVTAAKSKLREELDAAAARVTETDEDRE